MCCGATKTAHSGACAAELESPCAATTEPTHSGAHVPQLRPDAAKKKKKELVKTGKGILQKEQRDSADYQNRKQKSESFTFNSEY